MQKDAATLKQLGDELSAICFRSETPDIARVIALIKAGADIETTYLDMTPLHLACNNGHAALAKTLVEHGADIHALDRNNSTPLFHACYKGSADIVTLLLSKGALADPPFYETENGRTPLIVAISYGNRDAAKALLEGGANPNARSRSGKTPAMAAVWQLMHETILLLADKGADLHAMETGNASAYEALACTRALSKTFAELKARETRKKEAIKKAAAEQERLAKWHDAGCPVTRRTALRPPLKIRKRG